MELRKYLFEKTNKDTTMAIKTEMNIAQVRLINSQHRVGACQNIYCD